MSFPLSLCYPKNDIFYGLCVCVCVRTCGPNTLKVFHIYYNSLNCLQFFGRTFFYYPVVFWFKKKQFFTCSMKLSLLFFQNLAHTYHFCFIQSVNEKTCFAFSKKSFCLQNYITYTLHLQQPDLQSWCKSCTQPLQLHQDFSELILASYSWTCQDHIVQCTHTSLYYFKVFSFKLSILFHFLVCC